MCPQCVQTFLPLGGVAISCSSNATAIRPVFRIQQIAGSKLPQFRTWDKAAFPGMESPIARVNASVTAPPEGRRCNRHFRIM